MILVTGGAGFIGSNFVLDWCKASTEGIVNVDKLTYAGNLRNLAPLKGNPQHHFVQGDIADSALLADLLTQHQIRAVVPFDACRQQKGAHAGRHADAKRRNVGFDELHRVVNGHACRHGAAR